MHTQFKIVVLFGVLSAVPALADEGGGANDKSLSPYFFIEGGDPDLDSLPLKDTHVHFEVSGVIADVTVRQTYTNGGKRPISARYVFPASTRAAVHGMKMTLGDQVIEARIRKRAQAKQEFEQAKQEGKSASLLEQDRPNVFSMNVANILPGDRIDVELRYTELLIPTAGEYQFIYPTVVGPRYSNQKAESAPTRDRFVATPYLHEGQLPSYSFGLEGTISAGVPVSAVVSSSHLIHSDGHGEATRVSLDPSETIGGNRDFILRYRLTGDRIASGLSLYRGKDENFFLLMVQPPKRVTEEMVPPREYVFIVDVSGSMHGFPLEISKELLRNLIGSLRPSDRFNVLLFSGASKLMAPRSVTANQTNIDHALRVIDSQDGGGGTELLPAIERAMSLPGEDDVARSFVVITDGYIAAEHGVFKYIRDHLGRSSVFAFGIGTSVNRFLIEGVAKAGMGEPFIVTRPDEARVASQRFAEYLRSPVLTQVQLRVSGFDVYDVEPSAIPTVFADRPVLVYGKWRGKPQGSLTLSGIGGQGQKKFVESIDVARVEPGETNRALSYLWARSRIADLTDSRSEAGSSGDDGLEQSITELGLKYSLLTEFTSFIAVHERVRTGNPGEEVVEPLPLPEGVGDQAVGVGAEPDLVLVMTLIAAVLGFAVVRARQRSGA